MSFAKITIALKYMTLLTFPPLGSNLKITLYDKAKKNCM
jgi:hypothetical protein